MKEKFIDINKIKIPKAFSDSTPKSYKYKNIEDFFLQNNKFDKPIVIRRNNILTDGYIRYLVAKNNNVEKIPFIYEDEVKQVMEYPVSFITGKFVGCEKEYVWKNTKGFDLKVGDKAIVKSWDTSHKKIITAVVTVTNVFESDLITMLRHKTVIGVQKE